MITKFENFINEGSGIWSKSEFKKDTDKSTFNASDKIFRVGNNLQRMLFKNEIKGQISDGHWENTNPKNHWIPWITCKLEIGEPVGREFNVKKCDYALCSKDLLSVVGGRMWLASRYMEANYLAKLSKDTYNIIESIYVPWNNGEDRHSRIIVEEKLKKTFEEILMEAIKVAERNKNSNNVYRKNFAEKTLSFIELNRDKLAKGHKSTFSYKDLLIELESIKTAMKTSIEEGVLIDDKDE